MKLFKKYSMKLSKEQKEIISELRADNKSIRLDIALKMAFYAGAKYSNPNFNWDIPAKSSFLHFRYEKDAEIKGLNLL